MRRTLIQDHFSNQALAAHAKFQEQPCLPWSELYEGKKSYEMATLASARRHSIAPVPGSETHPLAKLSLIVVGDVGKKFLARRRDKTRPFHRVLRLASAKTFSAEKA